MFTSLFVKYIFEILKKSPSPQGSLQKSQHCMEACTMKMNYLHAQKNTRPATVLAGTC